MVVETRLVMTRGNTIQWIATGDDPDILDLYAETVRVVGSTRELWYQICLEDIQEKMNTHDETFPFQLDYDPDNPMDANAIVVQALHNSTWTTSGTIPRQKNTK